MLLEIHENIFSEHLSDSYGVYMRLEVKEECDWVYVDWIGYVNEARAKTGMMHYLDVMQEYKLTKLLNDNTKEHGPYPEDIEGWIASTWYPKALKINMTKGATILSPRVFARLSADKLVRTLSGIEYMNFDNKEKAISWLRTTVSYKNH
ncbi:MAG: hypothetical protein HC896_07990 [Bacteroidales bacterium]|nr:hypothetical protein [Bacteroidales bacterium]